MDPRIYQALDATQKPALEHIGFHERSGGMPKWAQEGDPATCLFQLLSPERGVMLPLGQRLFQRPHGEMIHVAGQGTGRAIGFGKFMHQL